ncbi:connectin-like [Palaemon carinicauda]|uniref:connectin-like n=1 Tax=Palaemon carinicauda TaxID=392227 RepID=UPI0035B5D4EF
MSPEKLFFHMKLLLCLVIVASEGKKRKNRNRNPEAAAQSQPALGENFNMCDIQTPEVIYCYCDVLDPDQAEEGNCWIFNDTGEHQYIWEGFMSQTKIKRLTLHLRPDGTLATIPTVAFHHLPNLEMFEVQYATFKSVHPYSFANSTTLTKVSLSRNSILFLARNSFTHLPALDTLSLGENHITEVNRHVFVDLPRLTKLYMDRNNITIVHDRAFQGLHNLVELELFSNQVQVITPDTFKGLRSLERLDLHKNRIEVIGDMTFQDLTSLRILDLQENSLKYISPKGFVGLSKLERLNLQDNKLLSIGSEVFKPAPNINHLDIRANVLETLTLETMQPLMDSLNNHTTLFFLEGNNFRCDTRLRWMFGLRNTTRSTSVRLNLEGVICYLEIGTLPPRLDDQTVTPAYETTTLGIGPMTKLFALRESELPDPMRYLQTADPDCDDEEEGGDDRSELSEDGEGGRRRGRGRGRGRKKAERNKTQNDMAPPMDENSILDEGSRSLGHPPAPVQEESRSFDSGAPMTAASSPSGSLVLVLALLLAFLQHRAAPH